MKKLSLIIIIVISLLFIHNHSVKAEDYCEGECSRSASQTPNGLVLCRQLCLLNETNYEILKQVKRIAELHEKQLKGKSNEK